MNASLWFRASLPELLRSSERKFVAVLCGPRINAALQSILQNSADEFVFDWLVQPFSTLDVKFCRATRLTL